MKGRIYKNKLSQTLDTDFKKTKQSNFYNVNHSLSLNRVSSQPQLNHLSQIKQLQKQKSFINNLNQHSQIVNHFQQTLKTANQFTHSIQQMPQQNYWKSQSTYAQIPPLKMSMGAFQYMDQIQKRGQQKIARIQKKYQMVIQHLQNTLDAKNLVIKELKQILDQKENAIIDLTKQLQSTSRQNSSRF